MKDLIETKYKTRLHESKGDSVSEGERLEQDFKDAGIKRMDRNLDEITIYGKNSEEEVVLWSSGGNKVQMSISLNRNIKSDIKSIMKVLKKFGIV